jgi:hypothetical protein
MKKPLLIFLPLLLLSITSLIAQSPQISPLPINITWCPGEEFTYEVTTAGAQQTSCVYKWTVTKGTIVNGVDNQRTVKVIWDDKPETGKLKITLSNCSEASNTSDERNYPIRSLKDRVPQNLRYNQLQPYCSTLGIHLAVDIMWLENTGAGTSVQPQQRADGYEWDLPTGWKHNGVGGKVTTPQEFINISPDDGCVGGTVTVKAYMNCFSGKKYSAPKSISINRPTPSIIVTPPSGYAGPSCGAVQPVTFTVTPISCATDYLWVFPSGWLQSPVYTPTNSITVTPSGGELDAGTIQVTVNLTCGSQLPSIPYTLNYNPPAIVPTSAICFEGTNVTLTNVAPSITVNWSVSSNINIFSGQGTPNAVMKASTSSFRGTGTIDATVNCPNTTVPQKITWVGMPNQITDILKGSGAIAIGATVPFSIQDPNNMNTGIVTYDWDVSGGYFAWIDTYAWTTITEPYLVLYAGSRNACGSLGMTSRGWNIDNPGGCPPGEICEMSVYPNPSSDELTVSLTSTDTKSTITNVKLVDSNGTVVYSATAEMNAKDIRILVKDLKNGTYYLSITQGQTIKQQQIIIRH